jgi:hypothetical protein
LTEARYIEENPARAAAIPVVIAVIPNGNKPRRLFRNNFADTMTTVIPYNTPTSTNEYAIRNTDLITSILNLTVGNENIE